MKMFYSRNSWNTTGDGLFGKINKINILVVVDQYKMK